MQRLFVIVFAGGLLFAAGAAPALAADRYIVFVNDAAKQVSAAMLQGEKGQMVVVKYGDIRASGRLTFDVADADTEVHVNAGWCGLLHKDVPRGKTQIVFSEKCSVTVR